MHRKAPRIFVKSEQISKHLYCAICHQVFDNPNRLSCGHTFCYLCIQRWASMSKLCPICKTSLKNRKPQKDLIASSIIDDFLMKCSYLNCKWQGPYTSLKKHRRDCQFKPKNSLTLKIKNNSFVQLDQYQQQQIQQINGKKKMKLQHHQSPLPLFHNSNIQNSQKRQDHQNNSLNNSNQSLQTNSMELDIQINLIRRTNHNNENNMSTNNNNDINYFSRYSERSSSSSFSQNPFDRSIPEQNNYIVIDSSREQQKQQIQKQQQIERQKQSGIISIDSIQYQITRYTPAYEFQKDNNNTNYT